MEGSYPIKVVVERTGLSPHVIRVWERRYGAVTPTRSSGNRRLYTAGEIERLQLLQRLVERGQSIGYVAKLPTETLRRLAMEAEAVQPSNHGANNGLDGESLVDECLAAVRRMDSRGLESVLDRAETELGVMGMIQRVVGPLARGIGELWADGSISAAHEHFATAVIRTILGRASRPYAQTSSSPVLVAATPPGQLHELGALLAAATAANLGWHVIYLGSGLPVSEIAGVAKENGARVVALSLVYPEDDHQLEPELIRLRGLLPGEIRIVVGGRAMPAYRDGLKKIGAILSDKLSDLRTTLDGIRRNGRGH